MIRKVLQSSVQLLIGLLVLFCLSRLLLRALPGDPTHTLLSESGFKIDETELKKELGLDQPWSVSLRNDLGRLAHFDFGRSLHSRETIAPELWNRTKNTLLLSLTATLIGLLIGLPLGIYSVINAKIDRLCSTFGSLTASIPTSWLGPILALTFGIWIPLFSLTEHIALPALTLGIAISGTWSRVIRERVREHWLRGSSTAARARGLSRSFALLKYAVAPGGGFLVSYFLTGLGMLLSGAFVTETLFSWDGLGSWMIEAILRRDYPIFEATFFVTTVCSLIANRTGTLLATWLDPKHAA